MERPANPAKRRRPDEPDEPGARALPAGSKRQRQHAPADFQLEPDDVEQQNMQFLSRPEVKDALAKEASLLPPAFIFKHDDPDVTDAQQTDITEAHESIAPAEQLPIRENEQSEQPDDHIIDVDALRSHTSSDHDIAQPQAAVVPYWPRPWGPPNALSNEFKPQLSTAEHDSSSNGDNRNQHRSWLDASEQQSQGSLWSQVRSNHLKSLLIDPRFVLRSAQVERDDFLKACMRLSHFAHPERLSDLLGHASRPRDYCKFVLNFLLALYNTGEVRAKTGPHRCFVTHPDISVYQDGNYADNDPIVKRIDNLEKDKQNQQAADGSESMQKKGDTYEEELIYLPEHRLAEESDEEESEVTTHKSQQLRLQDHDMDQLCDFASYVLRSYMYNVSGETFYSVDEFGKYCTQQGLSFLDSEQSGVEHQFERLKWLDEPVLDPTLGKAKTIKEPLSLWHHAINTFSAQNLARCALIQTDSLLDWLEHVTRLRNNPRTLEDFYASERPVVCFAPVALLHLADTAVFFALEVLQASIHFVEKDILYEQEREAEEGKTDEDMTDLADDGIQPKSTEDKESSETFSTLIEREDVRRAASLKLMTSQQSSYFLLNQILQAEPLPDGSLHPLWFEAEWPQRIIRPYTASTEFELCSRRPEVKVTVPHSVMTETTVILMGVKSKHHLLFYTKGSSTTGVPKRLWKSLSGEEAKRLAKEANESWASISEGQHLVEKEKYKHEQNLNPSPNGDGDVQMTDAVLNVVGPMSTGEKEKTVRPSSHTDLVPSEKGKGVSHETKDIKVQNVQVMESTTSDGLNVKAHERKDEPHFSNSNVPTKPEGAIKIGPADSVPEAKVMSSEEATDKNEDVAHQEENETKESRQCAPGEKIEDHAVEVEPSVKRPDGTTATGLAVPKQEENVDGGPKKDAILQQVKNENEIITKEAATEQESLAKKYASFFGIANPAEAVLASVGLHEWRKMSRKDLRATVAGMKRISTTKDAGKSTEDSESGGDLLYHRASSICYNRLRWIVFHALGVTVEKDLCAEKPLAYASIANYTNFRQLRSKKPLAIADDAFFLLAQLTEQYVRHEAEILMDCAAHDDGRPWIDRADVALVHAVRKKDFPYNNL